MTIAHVYPPKIQTYYIASPKHIFNAYPGMLEVELRALKNYFYEDTYIHYLAAMRCMTQTIVNHPKIQTHCQPKIKLSLLT